MAISFHTSSTYNQRYRRPSMIRPLQKYGNILYAKKSFIRTTTGSVWKNRDIWKTSGRVGKCLLFLVLFVSFNIAIFSYGKRGANAIRDAIASLFPVDSLCKTRLGFKCRRRFLKYILVPEMAIHLIRNDCQCSMDTAFEIWLGCHRYGIFLFE